MANLSCNLFNVSKESLPRTSQSQASARSCYSLIFTKHALRCSISTRSPASTSTCLKLHSLKNGSRSSRCALKLSAGTKTPLFGEPSIFKPKHLIILYQSGKSQSATYRIFADHQSVHFTGPLLATEISKFEVNENHPGYTPHNHSSQFLAARSQLVTGSSSRRSTLNGILSASSGNVGRASFATAAYRSSNVTLNNENGGEPDSTARSIHPTAVIHPNAIIMEGVTIGPFCSVGGSAVIGRNTRLEASSHVFGDTEIGEACTLHTGAVVGSDIPGKTTLGNNNKIGYYSIVGVHCQDLKYQEGSACFLEIGHGNDIREHCSIHRSSRPDDVTVVGDGNLIMGGSHVAHDCKIGNRNILANGTLLAGHVIVQDHVHSGGASAVHQFCHIGSYSFLAGGSMVTLDVPPYCMVMGDRAELRGLNLEGLKRAGFTQAQILGIRRVYRKLFVDSESSVSMEGRLSQMEADDDARADHVVFSMVQFIRDSFSEDRRGIVKSHKEIKA